MKCNKCGAEHPSYAKFCAKCGARVATDAQYAPDSGSYTNYAQQPAKKKRSFLAELADARNPAGSCGRKRVLQFAVGRDAAEVDVGNAAAIDLFHNP